MGRLTAVFSSLEGLNVFNKALDSIPYSSPPEFQACQKIKNKVNISNLNRDSPPAMENKNNLQQLK